jgi:hypothetical protein
MGTVLVLGALLLIPIVAGEPAAAQTITFTKVADTTTSIPGVGAIFRSFSSPSIDGNAVAFLGNDGPFFSGNDGIYIDVDGSLDVVANVSTQVPGGVSNFDSFDLDVSIEGTDVVFIGETLSPAGSGVYVSVDGVGFETVADTDTQVPGSQGFFSGFLDASLSGGDVAFSGTGPSGNGVYTDVGGPLRVIVDPTTMYPGGGTFPTFGNPTPSLDDGIVAFTSLNSDNSRSSVFNDVGGTLVIVADEDTPVPGGQGTFSRIGAEVATNQGSVAFSAGSESFSTSGIYTDAGGTLRLVANSHMLAPGTQETFVAFDTEVSLDAGTVVFKARAGAVNGIYAEVGGTLLKIIDTTDQLEGAAVTNLGRLSNEAVSGNRVTFRATTGSRTGIYIATVPEPGAVLATALALVAVAGLASIRGRERSRQSGCTTR